MNAIDPPVTIGQITDHHGTTATSVTIGNHHDTRGTDIIGTPLDRTGITPIGNTSRDTAATPTGTNDNLHTTRIMSVNCYGLKSSFLTVIDWMKDIDILFLCESWLRPCEIAQIKSKLSDHNLLSYMKSSMDPELLQHGRPHGGVGFIL